MAHDLVIRGGDVIDGSGGERRRADVAIDGDRVVAIGDVSTAGAGRVIDATDRIVTPGFVDLHSHLDAQIGWDPLMSSSCWHGVTSVVLGNCGMTFAPVKAGAQASLATAMESVEDIPAQCILDGLPWTWESFGEYLATLDGLPLGLNAGGHVGDVAVRMYVAGESSCEAEFRASEEQLSQMGAIVEQAMRDGALGYSISRSLFHRVPDGRNVPGTWSPPEEFFAIAESLGRVGSGVLEMAPRYNFENEPGDRVDEELAWMAELSIATGRPFCFNLQQIESLGDHFLRVIELSERANARGARLRPQITPRCVGVLFSLAGNSLLDDLPSFVEVAEVASTADRMALLRNPQRRARLIAEGAHKTPDQFDRMFVMPSGAPAVYSYGPEDSLGAWARARGTSVVETYLDILEESNGASVINWPVMNQREDAIEEMLAHSVTVLGLADAGAHATQIMDASQSTYLLSHWARDRKVVSLEEAIRRLSSDTADLMGLRDRGTLRVGAFADVNVIDVDRLALPLPEITHDFPGGAARFIQRAEGFDYTLVNGEVFMESGLHTGALPGRVLRSTD